jgi:restriction system protein
MAKEVLLRDRLLVAELEELKAKVVAWAKKHDLWYDSDFRPAFEHRDEPPREGEVLYLLSDGPLCSVFSPDHEHWDRLDEEFRGLLNGAGYECELEDNVTLNITPISDAKKRDFLRLQRWQWIQRLAEKRLYDLHVEVFEHFAAHPETLQNLHWRQFEEFLDAIFRNQGYRTELGPGGNDGGVDLRLYQSETIPELVTLVQAKKYASPIKLDAVAALAGVAQMERVPNALFVTSSRYQPKARQFAYNTQSRHDMPSIQLADGKGVGEWCASISKQLTDYFQTGETPLPPVIHARPPTQLTGKVVVASYGYNTTWNTFAVIEADYPHEVILRTIGARTVEDDGYGQRGTEAADFSAAPSRFDPPRFLAFKTDGGYFWGDRKLFGLWDGTPQRFDYCD